MVNPGYTDMLDKNLSQEQPRVSRADGNSMLEPVTDRCNIGVICPKPVRYVAFPQFAKLEEGAQGRGLLQSGYGDGK